VCNDTVFSDWLSIRGVLRPRWRVTGTQNKRDGKNNLAQSSSHTDSRNLYGVSTHEAQIWRVGLK
jgi:hypothetical protein